MKLHGSKKRNQALTLVEVVAVIAVLVLLVIVFSPALNPLNRRPNEVSCAGLVRQIGLSFQVWGGDHGDKLPMEVSVVNGGAKESVAGGNAAAVFQVISNELTDPRILHCPRDTEHSVFPLAPGPQFLGSIATNFSGDLKNHISYFIGLDASANHPDALLSGDDNFGIGSSPAKSGLLEIPANAPIDWTSARHTTYKRYIWDVRTSYGNVCLADGSVQQTTGSSLTSLLRATGLATNRLAIP